jgi:hypothetical protein
MGIYPDTTYTVNRDGTLTRTVKAPGITRTVVYAPIVELEHRTDCYCCSCGDQPGSDPYCRNHGYAGERPCTVHGMPGDDPALESVQDHLQKKFARG